MSSERKIVGDPEVVKSHIANGEAPEWAEKFAAYDLVKAEFDGGGRSESSFARWLWEVKHIGRADMHTVIEKPDVWFEWLDVKTTYAAEQKAKWDKIGEAQRTIELARKSERNEAAARDAADLARREVLADQLQKLVIETPELPPVNWIDVHRLKKHPEKSKRDLARRWREIFLELPLHVQEAWRAFFSPVSVITSAGDPVVSDDDDTEAEGDEVERIPAPASLDIYLTPYAPGERAADSGNADAVQAGVNDPAFRTFMPYSASMARLFNLIGYPIDDVVLPPLGSDNPLPAQELDDIDAPSKPRYVVPGMIPLKGLTAYHGDEGSFKSLFMQKQCLVIADRDGAKWEGIEVEHGPVIFCTLDPSASREEVKPGIIEIRARLNLKPSGRFHLTDTPLILNEPSSVAAWLDLNRARLPAKVIGVDSLASAVTGSLISDAVMLGCVAGIKALLRHADAVILSHHDNKEGDPFGSKFLKPMTGSMVGFVHPRNSDGTPTGRLTVTVERLKFERPTFKRLYRNDGPFLDARIAATDGRTDDLGDDAPPMRRPDLWAMVPPVTTRHKLRRAVEPYLTGDSRMARDKEWSRIVKAWLDAKLITVTKGGVIRRTDTP